MYTGLSMLCISFIILFLSINIAPKSEFISFSKSTILVISSDSLSLGVVCTLSPSVPVDMLSSEALSLSSSSSFCSIFISAVLSCLKYSFGVFFSNYITPVEQVFFLLSLQNLSLIHRIYSA